MNRVALRRRMRFAHTRMREWRMIAKGLLSTQHPVLAHLIAIRCNLSCAYCHEYDNYSKPVPLGGMLRQVDRLAELGTTPIALSGGVPDPWSGSPMWRASTASSSSRSLTVLTRTGKIAPSALLHKQPNPTPGQIPLDKTLFFW